MAVNSCLLYQAGPMDDLDALYAGAFAAYRAGAPREAEATLETLLARAPTDAKALLLKSVVHPKDERTICLALVEHAVQLDPFNPEAWYNLGAFENERGRLKEALGCYRRAVLIELTSSGRLTATTIRQTISDLEHRALDGVPHEAVAAFRAVLRALTKAEPA